MNNFVWSVVIPSYNSSSYIEETLNSILAQDPGEDVMEIIVVDNCSSDNTEQLVSLIGKGRVKFVSNEKNLGVYGNFNRCVKIAKGQLVHMLHADDLVKPGFYSTFQQIFDTLPDVYLATCNSEIIDENGNCTFRTPPLNSLLIPANNVVDLLYRNPIPAPAVVVRKKAYEILGDFDTQFTHVADWDMWVRIVYNFKALHINKVLCQYRMHSKSDTSKVLVMGENIIDTARVFKKFKQIGLPIDDVQAKLTLRHLAERQFAAFYKAGNLEAANNMIRIHRMYTGVFRHLYVINKIKLIILLQK